MHVRVHAAGQQQFARRVNLAGRFEVTTDLDDALGQDCQIRAAAVGEGAATYGEINGCHRLSASRVPLGLMTDSSRPRVFVSRIIPDEGLKLVAAQTDADIW